MSNILNVSVSSVPFEKNTDRGRPQTNARLYLTMVNTQRLIREGWTEKQLRRQAFAQVRETLGLDKDTVIARSTDGSYFMVKSDRLRANFEVRVSAASAE